MMSLSRLTASRALDLYFLEARAKLLDLAAILDRFQAGEGAENLPQDSRWSQIRDALAVLNSDAPDKAERIQMIFSQTYDPSWPRPQPRL